MILVDPIDEVYKGSPRLQLYGERAYYRDEDHLSRHGADVYLRSTISGILDEITTGRR